MHLSLQKRYPDTSIRIGAFSTETLPEYNVSGTQEAPDIDPVLSSGALKLNPRKLEKVPWDHTGEHPGSKLAWSAIKSLAILSKYYLFRSIEEQAPKESEGGRIYASIHINGLVDPLSIILSQEKRPITMGRHDLATMPFIGWLTRRMGNQPVIRRAEQSSGVSGAEFALSINHRTLLTMSHCISGGHGAVVMPEGKSHQDSRLHKLRTGAMRFAINASTIAHAKDLPKPVIQPVGLHFRCHHWFRTDLFVEYPEPIQIPIVDNPLHSKSLIEGTWIEPPEDMVIHLRDELQNRLSEVTPEAPDWETYRAWHLLAQIKAHQEENPMLHFSDEVIGARHVRELLKNNKDPEMIDNAKKASTILYSRDLDARSISKDLSLDTRLQVLKGAIGMTLMMLAAPLSIFSTGLQSILAWYLGNNTDEGIDARTTHHMFAVFFSPITLWPIFSFALAYYLLQQLTLEATPLALSLGALLMFVAFQISNTAMLLGYDLWSDFTSSRRRRILSKTEDGKLLSKLIHLISPKLVALK